MELHLSNNDYYKIYKASLISDNDLKTIVSLYQPIIGNNAAMLYNTFLNEIDFQEWVPVSTHEMLSKKTGLNLVDISVARKRLEAIGLVKSYRKVDENDIASYYYFLYAPKSPASFFKDPLFVGLLTSVVGEKELSRLKRVYFVKEPNLNGFKEVTVSYKSVYDQNKFALIPEGEKLFTNNVGLIKDELDIKSLIKLMKEKYGFANNLFNESIIFEVTRLATLFGLKEETMASCLNHVYNASEKTFDLEELYSVCRNTLIVPVEKDNSSVEEYDNDSKFAKKVNYMNQCSPYDYLKVLSHNSNPSPADVAILNTLSREYGLNNGVINAIIEYTLNVCDNELPRAFCEKLAATLKRKNIVNAMEAINALTSKKGRKKKIVETNNDNEVTSSEEVSDEDFMKMMEGL